MSKRNVAIYSNTYRPSVTQPSSSVFPSASKLRFLMGVGILANIELVEQGDLEGVEQVSGESLPSSTEFEVVFLGPVFEASSSTSIAAGLGGIAVV
ncbi:hypothetical protein HanIR_Chr14g0681341 [Helianthus annuus]|nr:hypothetical protein HanIR_Chr14g0681341 [Helianthus annuus]